MKNFFWNTVRKELEIEKLNELNIINICQVK